MIGHSFTGPRKRLPSSGGCKPTPEVPFSPTTLARGPYWPTTCPAPLGGSGCPFGRRSQGPTHLQVGDVSVNVHGGCLAVLRDVLVILGAGLPIHTVDTGDGNILIAPSHVPGRRGDGAGWLGQGVRASLGARRGLGEGRGCSGGSLGAGSKVPKSKAGHLVKNLNFRSDNQEIIFLVHGFPGDSDSKESACNVGDLGSNPGLARSPGGGHGNPVKYSCLENPMGRGTWQATVHEVTRLDRTERLTLSLSCPKYTAQNTLKHFKYALFT